MHWSEKKIPNSVTIEVEKKNSNQNLRVQYFWFENRANSFQRELTKLGIPLRSCVK